MTDRIKLYLKDDKWYKLENGVETLWDEDAIRADEKQKVLAEVESWLVDEVLPSYSSWLRSTKRYGGTENEYLDLEDIVNNQNQLRAELRAKLAEMKGENETWYTRIHISELINDPLLLNGFLPKGATAVRVEREPTTNYYRVYYKPAKAERKNVKG